MSTSARSVRKARPSRAKPPTVDLGILDPIVGDEVLSQLAAVNGGSAGPRSKRAAIIDIAVARFGGVGYEATKWSQVADEVGIGQTALYHYFESKAHCLLTIMRLELARSHQRFLAANVDASTPTDAIRRSVIAAFDIEASEVSQLRILMANGDILANPRASEREESERVKCLALAHRIEVSWTLLVQRRLAETPKDDRDPKMLALLVLGLINSMWRWFRADGAVPINTLSTLYLDAAMRIIE